MSQDNTPPTGKPNLRLVGAEDPPLTKSQNDIVTALRDAIEMAQAEPCIGVMVALIREDGSIMNVNSGTQQKHTMVAAAAYQLFDIVNAGAYEVKA